MYGKSKIIGAFFFILNAFIGTLLYYYEVMKRNIASKETKGVSAFYVALVVFISLYNCTKIPENDLAWIVELYTDAGHYSFSSYITMLARGKEVLYCAISYLLYYLCFGNVKLFVFALSVISYSSLFAALYKFNKSISATRAIFITSAITMAFFPYSYALSVHIVRQFMGLCICSFGVIGYITSDSIKKKILYLVIGFCSIFIHTSSGLVFFLGLIPFLHETINRKNAFKFAVLYFAISSFMKIAQSLLPFFLDTSFAYGLDKLAEGTTYETTIPIQQMFFVSAIIILCVFSCYRTDSLRTNRCSAFMTNTLVIIFLFVIINYNTNIEMAQRFQMDIWILTPFAISVIIYNYKSYLLHVFSHLGLLTFWIYYNANISMWTYTCSDLFWAYPAFLFLI